MGLYGNLLTAPDGSIFTFDKIYRGYYTDSGEEIVDSNQQKIQRQQWATHDGVMTGRFIFIQDTCEIYMKTVKTEDIEQKETNGETTYIKSWTYEYVLIANLLFAKQMAEAAVDDWIGITTDQNGVLNIVHRGPKIKEEYKETAISENQYEKNKFYIKNELGKYELCDDEIFEQQEYYILTQIREDIPIGYYEEIEINDSNYEPNKYYYQNSEGVYILSTSAYESDKTYYNFIKDLDGFNQTVYLPKINYDRKGHIENVQPIIESDDFTLILNGGAFLEKNKI